jgi:pimeloyl-ACP methyl ester carboxylesterase
MKTNHRPPVLLVPGALNGAWVWEDNFKPFFESAGFDVHTFEFPSHSERGLRRQALTLEDYRQHLVNKIGNFSLKFRHSRLPAAAAGIPAPKKFSRKCKKGLT